MSVYNDLYDWQRQIVDRFHDRRAFGLFLDCGLGKTPISLAFAERHKCTKVIIITINSKVCEPPETTGSWYWWLARSDMAFPIDDKKSEKITAGNSVFIINYESLFERTKDKTRKMTLRPIVLDFIKSCKNHKTAVIVDESHKVKNLSALQTMAINEIRKRLALTAPESFIYLLTGTPFTTGYIDLHAQLKLLGCEMTKTAFKERFCEMGNKRGLLGWQQPIVGYKNLPELFDLVHKYAITVNSEDVVKLPEKIFVEHALPATDDFLMFMRPRAKSSEICATFKRRGEAIESQYAAEITKTKNNPFYRNIAYPRPDFLADTPGAMWLRTRQLSIGFQGNADVSAWYDRTRIEAVKRLLNENKDNYILFYNYTPELLELYPVCAETGYNIDIYCGEIKSLVFYNRFAEMTEGQQMVTKGNIILTNFASGSTGMNWQAYNKCIVFSVPLYKDFKQGFKRISRMGQKNTTVYHVFYQRNWLDKSMLEALDKKSDYSLQMFESDLQRAEMIIKDKN